LPELADLQVLAMDIESFEGILDVPKLESIRIEGCEVVESLDGLEACEGLESIFVARLLPDQANLMSDLGALSDMPTLKSLEIAGAAVSDISPLAGLPLERLDITDNQVESIDALAEMPLSSLRISGNPVVSLEPLGTLSSLEQLAMQGVGATSLDLLAGAPLTHLDVADNSVSDIALSLDWDLVELLASNNDIVSLPDGFVGGQGSCSRTDLSGNPLDQAAQDTLLALCEPPSNGSGYMWDGGSCPPICEVP